MKKFFLLMVFIAASISAHAQLNIKTMVKSEPKKIETIQPAYSWLYETENGKELWLDTSNKYDRGYTHIFLGDTNEGCIQTITDLLSLIENEIAGTEVEQNGKTLVLMYKSNLGVKQLYVKQSGNAGYSWITENQLRKLLDFFK